MIGLLSNTAMANMASNSATRVAAETTLKAIGRPSFILIDNNIDSRTKKYAATKELLYQTTCLGVYLALVLTLFPRGAFKVAKKLFKNHPEFSKFDNAKEYLEYHKLASKSKQNRLASFQKSHSENKFKDKPELRNALLNEEKPEKYPIIKGAIELGTVIGSVLGLAILAPEVGHRTIHPIMQAVGMEQKPDKNTGNLDTNA